MAKFAGVVGYGHMQKVAGVSKDVITEKSYFGNVNRNTKSNTEGDSLNKDVSVGNEISIVADAYAVENFLAIRFVEWLGVLWTVDSVEVQHPRLTLRLGGVYNGPRENGSPDPA